MNRVKSFFRMPAKIEYPDVRLEFAVSRECTLVSSLAHIYIFWVEAGSRLVRSCTPCTFSSSSLLFFLFLFFFSKSLLLLLFSFVVLFRFNERTKKTRKEFGWDKVKRGVVMASRRTKK